MSRLNEPTNEASAMQKEISAIAEQGEGTTKVEQLIQQYCPDGVEYKKLGEITTILRGKRLTKSQLSNDKPYAVYHGGLEPLGYYESANRTANTTMIINVGASAGTIGYSKEDFWSSDGCYCIEHSASFDDRYIYYVLQTQEQQLKSKLLLKDSII